MQTKISQQQEEIFALTQQCNHFEEKSRYFEAKSDEFVEKLVVPQPAYERTLC
jgi:hypothetical protein